MDLDIFVRDEMLLNILYKDHVAIEDVRGHMDNTVNFGLGQKKGK